MPKTQIVKNISFVLCFALVLAGATAWSLSGANAQMDLIYSDNEQGKAGLENRAAELDEELMALHMNPDDELSEDIEFSLSTVILFALENNPQLGVSLSREKQALYSIDEAKADLYPRVDALFSIGRDMNDPGAGDEIELAEESTTGTDVFTLSFNQLLFDGFATREAIKGRQQLHNSSQIQTGITAEGIILQAIDSYLDVYRTQRVYSDTIRFLRRIREINDKVGIMVEAGAASQAKFGFAKARLAFAKTQMQNIQAEFNDAVSSLEFLTGDLPEFIALRPDELDPSVLDLDFYLEMAAKQNAQMRLNESNKKALVHQLKSEEGQDYPTVNFDFSINQRNDDGGEIGLERDITSTVEVTYNIFDGFRNKATRNRIQSQIEETHFRRQQILDTLEREIKLRYNQIAAIQANIEITQGEIQNNLEVQKLNYENFELGNIDIIELIEGEERLNGSRSRLNGLITNLYFNTFELLQFVGALQKDTFCESC